MSASPRRYAAISLLRRRPQLSFGLVRASAKILRPRSHGLNLWPPESVGEDFFIDGLVAPPSQPSSAQLSPARLSTAQPRPAKLSTAQLTSAQLTSPQLSSPQLRSDQIASFQLTSTQITSPHLTSA